MHHSPSISPVPSPRTLCCRRQEHCPIAYLSLYFFSQWEMCSTSADSCTAGIAFSTGITCIPIPAPPSGTIGVTFSSGSLDIFSKKSAISVCFSTCSLFITMNSALPGTYIGRMYCFSCCGFSQLYSMIPTTAISCSSFSNSASGFLVFFASFGRVIGLRTSMHSATSAISSVTTPARPQYSGSFTVSFSIPSLYGIRSVIFFPSFKISSLSSAITVSFFLCFSLFFLFVLFCLVCFRLILHK